MIESDKAAFAEILTDAMQLHGREVTVGVLRLWWELMRKHDFKVVRGAFVAYLDGPSGKFPPTPAAINEYIPDGRPAPDEAWAMIPMREEDSAMLTDEMQEGLRACSSLIDSDRVAARMAFKDAYSRACSASKAQGKPVVWTFSPGWDQEGRVKVLAAAVEAGRLGHAAALRLVPGSRQVEFLRAAGVTDHPLLAAPTEQQRADQERINNIVGSVVSIGKSNQ